MDDLFSLQGKSAVVVGAGGMGNAIADGLASYGARVAIADANPATLEHAAAEIEATTGQRVGTYQVERRAATQSSWSNRTSAWRWRSQTTSTS